MKQELSFHLRQKMVMAPKLQQAIKILQMSSQELHTAIENEYSENPVLEFDENVETGDGFRLEAEQINSFSQYLGEAPRRDFAQTDEGYDDLQHLPAPAQTLCDMLLEQASLAFSDAHELLIANYLIGCLDERGYLCAPLEDLSKSGGFSSTQGKAVLKVIQSFEPAGIGASSLEECLRLQAQRQLIYNGLIAAIIERHLPAVAKNKLTKIAEAEKTSLEEVQMAIEKIRTFEPKPGIAYCNERTTHIIPDIRVQKVGEEFLVFINDYTVPSLKISDLYRNTHHLDETTKKYVEKRINSAIWLINSIEQRRRTLLGVSRLIVKHQHDFFRLGPDYLRPLSMQTIAAELSVHESTVSRAIANKYMDTPHGIFSIRKFFTGNVASNMQGEQLTCIQIKKNIENLIGEENPQKPLSDQKLCDLLKQKGICISRRTVMKYREQLGIPSSSSRRQLK